MQCPKCGAEIANQLVGERVYKCGMVELLCQGAWEESFKGDICLTRQLAAMTAERDALRLYTSPRNGSPLSPAGVDDLVEQLGAASSAGDSMLHDMASNAIRWLRRKSDAMENRVAELESQLAQARREAVYSLGDEHGTQFCVASTLRCVVLNAARLRGRHAAWYMVSEIVGCGSTLATRLCRHFGTDPESGRQLPATAPATPAQE